MSRALRVEQAAEHAGEREHVVDLVRVVGAAGRHDGGVLHRHRRVDLGVGVGQREHDRVRRHRGELGGAEEVRRGDADEDVGADERVGERARTPPPGWCCAAIETRLGVHAGHGPRARCRRCRPPDSHGALRRSSRMIAVPAAPDAADDDPAVGEPLADHPQRVAQRAEHDDRGAVLVVVEDRDVEQLAQPCLDLEAAGRGDVLQVDAAVHRGEDLHRPDDLLGVLGVQADGPGVDAGEPLEQRGLALHHRQRGRRAEVAEAEHGGAVGDDRDGVALDGQPAGVGRVVGDGLADPGDAGGVGAGRSSRLRRRTFECTSSLPPRCTRNVRSDTLRTRTPVQRVERRR